MTDPARVLDPGPIVLVDTAEQKPWAPFVLIKGESWLLQRRRFHLGTGDYAIAGLEKFARIERKAEDLCPTLFGSTEDSNGARAGNQERFRRELLRFNDPEVLVRDALTGIWIEGTVDDLMCRQGVHHNAFGSKQPWEAFNLLMSLRDYRVPIEFVGSRRAAELKMGTLFFRIWEQATDVKAIAKAEKRGVADWLPWIPPDEPDGCALCGKPEAGHDDAACSFGYTSKEAP